MKRILLALALSMGISAQATHLMGGEIIVQDLGGGDYLLALFAYRDTAGIPMATSATFKFYDMMGNSVFTTTTNYDSIISGNLLPMYPYGVEIYLFYDTITPNLPAGKYKVAWDNCCRNGAIQNLSAPLNESMYLETEFEIFANAPNSTPFFLVPPAIYLPVNTSWQYNPLPFDPDGDSLYWSIDTPLTNMNQYCLGYTTPPGAASNPFSIDPVTGTISWTANTLGNFVATVLVDEYRFDSTAAGGGQWMQIGQIRRDMQFIVVNANSSGHPRFTNLSNFPQNPQGYYTFQAAAGVPVNVTFIADHTDPNAQIFMGAFGEMFLATASNQASFNVTPTGNGNEIQGTLSWTPTMNDLRPEPYRTAVRVSDGFFVNDATVLIEVTSALGEDELELGDRIGVYPNPASDRVYVEINTRMDDQVRIDWLDITGRVVRSEANIQLKNGQNVIVLPVQNLERGLYFLRIQTPDATTQERIILE